MSLDMPSVFSNTVRKARREHKCFECGCTIKRGEKYHLAKGCWEGKWDEYKTCMTCTDILDDIRQLYRGDEGPAFGELAEFAHEAGIEFPAAVAL